MTLLEEKQLAELQEAAKVRTLSESEKTELERLLKIKEESEE